MTSHQIRWNKLLYYTPDVLHPKFPFELEISPQILLYYQCNFLNRLEIITRFFVKFGEVMIKVVKILTGTAQ